MIIAAAATQREPRRWARRAGLALAVAALAAAIGCRGELAASWGAAYPRDALARAALTDCALVDPSFIRFLASERAACYARFSRAVAVSTAAAPRQSPDPAPAPEPSATRLADAAATARGTAAAPVPYAALDASDAPPLGRR